GAVDLLPGVVAAARARHHLGTFHRLRIDDGRGGGRAAPSHHTDPFAQVIMHPGGRAVCLPLAGPVVHRPGRPEVGRQRPPARTVVGQVAYGIDDIAHAVTGGPAAPPGQPRRGRPHRLEDR